MHLVHKSKLGGFTVLGFLFKVQPKDCEFKFNIAL